MVRLRFSAKARGSGSREGQHSTFKIEIEWELPSFSRETPGGSEQGEVRFCRFGREGRARRKHGRATGAGEAQIQHSIKTQQEQI